MNGRENMLEFTDIALGAAGASMLFGAGYIAMPAPDFKDGWLTKAGARRHGLTGGSIPLGTMGRVFKETITAPKESFILCIGPTGSGKTKNLIENIIFNDKDNSQVVFDLKGDLLKATAHARSKLGPVYVLDPSGGPTNHYNPYIDIPVGDSAMIKDLQGWLIAKSRNDSPATEFYNSSAFNLSCAATEHVLSCEGYEKTMPAIFAFLRGKKWLAALQKSPVQYAREVSAGITEFMVDKNISTITALLHWLDYPGVKNVMSKSDFKFTDIQSATDPVTIYIRLPEQSRKNLMPFARVIIGMLTMSLMKSEKFAIDGAEKKRGVTFIIDEMKQLALPNIDTFFSAGRSFGGRVVVASQILSEVRDLYGKVVEGNCTTQLFTRTQDIDEATHISKMLPMHAVRKSNVTHSTSSHGNSRSVRIDDVEEPLMTATDVMKLPKHRCLVGVVDGHPVKLNTIYAPKAFADVREKPFTVTSYNELQNPWEDMQMQCSSTPSMTETSFTPRVRNKREAK